MKDFIFEQLEISDDYLKLTGLFDSSIDYSIAQFQKENIRVFLDYFYTTNKKMFELYETLCFVQREKQFFTEDELEQAILVSGLLFSSIDLAYNRKDFYELIKSLTVSNQNDDYLKKIYLDYFDNQKMNDKLKLKNYYLEQDLEKLFNIYNMNVGNVSYIQNVSIDDELVESVSENEKKAFFVKRNGKYYFKPSFSNLKDIKTNCQNAALRKQACELLSQEGKHPVESNNLKLANKMIQSRYEIAKLHNKNSFVEHTIKRNLLNKPDKIEAFIESVHSECYNVAMDEIIDLREFVKEQYQVNNLTYQDLYFYSSCYKGFLLNEKLSSYESYLQTDFVLEKAFELFNDIFDITFKKNNDMNFLDEEFDGLDFYEVYSKKELKTYMIIDLYERNNKPEDNYVISLKKHYKDNVGILFVNLFLKDSKRMTISDIEGLLHELGHVAESIAYESAYIFDEQTTYHEKDACEIISTTMEQYATDPEFLLLCSNGQLSEDEINQILKADSFLMSMENIYALACSEYDYIIHNNFKGNIELLHVDIFNKRSPLFDELGENLAYNFTHSFDGFYSGNYYCYLLAKILAKNLFKSLKKDPSMKKRFKYKIACRQDGLRLEDALKDFYNNEIPEELSFICK